MSPPSVADRSDRLPERGSITSGRLGFGSDPDKLSGFVAEDGDRMSGVAITLTP
jgi:hypothetical protein